MSDGHDSRGREPAGEAGHGGGSIEATLAGRADLRVGAVLREAWERTDGIKAPLIAGCLIIYAAMTVATLVLQSIFGAEPESPMAGAISQLVLMLIVYPFMGGVFMFGLNRSLGRPVHFEGLFGQYRRALPIVAVALVQGAFTLVGLLLLIVPGIYLSIALSLAVPLKVERDLPIMECLVTSLRIVNRKFLEVALLMLVSGALLVLGVLSLIGWIWTVPWTIMIFAITYRQLVGAAGPPGLARATAEY
jgi:uncharacterized membrane protein